MNKNQSITAKKALGLIANKTFGHKKSELPRFECFSQRNNPHCDLLSLLSILYS